jgi:conjugative relaxase-like TrwC/TraI family protein
MLGISRVSPGGGAYYLADLANELGPGGSGAPGGWLGAGAEGLGLAGSVQPGAIEAVLSGRAPSTCRPLAPRPGKVGGFDLTFSAPKSVSVLFALASPDVSAAVLEAHTTAVASAMEYVGERAMAVRRGCGEERELLATRGPVAATFAHGLSRALDPHLHTHVVVANLAQGTDGRWSAVDGRGLFAHRSAAGSLYEAQLRHGLTNALGLEWEPRRNGRREIAGVGPALLGAFSNRSAEIRSHLASGWSRRDRPLSGRARRVAWAATRDAKMFDGDRAALVSHWRAVASDVGSRGLSDVIGRARVAVTEVDEHRFAASFVTSAHAVATRRGVVAALAEALPHGAQVSEVVRSVDWVFGLGPHASAATDGTGIGVREPVQQLAGIVPGNYLLSALGPRPIEAPRQRAWHDAARSIDDYRRRWAVTDRSDALGHDVDLSRLPDRQLADRVRTETRVAELRRCSGRDRMPARNLSIGRG